MAINSNKEVNVDVLVIGGGNAALCAALMAREVGAGVLLLEAAPREWRGGNSAHTHNLRCMHDAPQLGMSASRPKPACWRPAASSPTARPDASTYKGGAPALQDLLGGRVAAYYSTPATAGPHIESGRLIPLATTGLTRPAFLPNVPTIAESGYPGFNALNWYAFVAPGKTPKLILDRWNLELVKVLNSPDVKEALLKRGLIPAPGSRDELARFMVSETTTWGRIVRERKITAD